jgi:hypothetical protein
MGCMRDYKMGNSTPQPPKWWAYKKKNYFLTQVPHMGDLGGRYSNGGLNSHKKMNIFNCYFNHLLYEKTCCPYRRRDEL